MIEGAQLGHLQETGLQGVGKHLGRGVLAVVEGGHAEDDGVGFRVVAASVPIRDHSAVAHPVVGYSRYLQHFTEKLIKIK